MADFVTSRGPSDANKFWQVVIKLWRKKNHLHTGCRLSSMTPVRLRVEERLVLCNQNLPVGQVKNFHILDANFEKNAPLLLGVSDETLANKP